MRVLFGIYGLSESEARSVVTAMKEQGVDISDYDLVFTKNSVLTYLNEHPDTSVVIFSVSLEISSPFAIEDVERMVEAHERVRFIPILSDDSQGTEYVKGLFHLGIMDGVCTSDSEIDTMSRLVRVGRSRKEAKVYYKIDEVEEVDNGADISQCIRYLTSSSDRELEDNAYYLYNRLDEKEWKEVIGQLPSETRKKIEQFSFIRELLPEKEPSAKETKSTFSAKKLTIPKPKFPTMGIPDITSLFQRGKTEEEEEPIAYQIADLKDVLSNVLIGFTGSQRRSGVTHQAIIAAHYLVSCGFKVALIDCATKGADAYSPIKKYRDVDPHTGYFTFHGVDYYGGVSVSGMNELFAAGLNYHFVIVDYGVCRDDVVKDIGRCSMKFAVCGGMPWELSFTRELYSRLEKQRESFYFLVRGISEKNSAALEAVDQILPDYLCAPWQEDPFSGECYPELADCFSVYNGKRKVPQNEKKSSFFQKETAPKRENNKKSARKVEYVGTAVCFVTSLKPGCGNSHFACTVANYMADRGKKVCLISNGEKNQYGIYDEIGFYKANGVYERLYSEYDFLVFDCGTYDDLSKEDRSECERANYKVMMCWSDLDYMERLARFSQRITMEEDRWIFPFTNVPDNKIKEVSSDMSGYTSCYLPVYDLDSVPKSVTRILNNLF